MFEIKVTPLVDVSRHATWKTKTIGAIDPDLTHLRPDDEDYHMEFFHDIAMSLLNFVHPTKEHLQRILDFSANFTPEDRVLIHCHQGVSRSTAIAIMVLVQHGMEPQDAVDRVFEVRDCMWPNDLIICLADDMLGQDQKLVEAVRAFKEKWNNTFVFPRDGVTQSDVDSMKDIMALLNG